MKNRIDILGLSLDRLYAKNALCAFIDYLDDEVLSIIEIITAERMLQMEEYSQLKREINAFDLLLPGDDIILKCAKEDDLRLIKELRERTMIRLFFQYLHKRRKRVYFLVETEDDGQRCYAALERWYGGIQLGGMAKVSAENRADDMLVNAINGEEIDCIISALPFPLQEEFVILNRNLLNARIWLGLGNSFFQRMEKDSLRKKWSDFFVGLLLGKEVKKSLKYK